LVPHLRSPSQICCFFWHLALVFPPLPEKPLNPEHINSCLVLGFPPVCLFSPPFGCKSMWGPRCFSGSPQPFYVFGKSVSVFFFPFTFHPCPLLRRRCARFVTLIIVVSAAFSVSLKRCSSMRSPFLCPSTPKRRADLNHSRPYVLGNFFRIHLLILLFFGYFGVPAFLSCLLHV